MAALLALAGAACLSDRNGAAAEREVRRSETTERSHSRKSDEDENDALKACKQRGTWACSPEAAWLRDVLLAAGYANVDLQGNAVLAGDRRSSFLMWTTAGGRSVREMATRAKFASRLAGVPIYADQRRLVWRAQRRTLWLAPGPGGEADLP